MESNDSPEIPDRGETSDISSLPSGGVGSGCNVSVMGESSGLCVSFSSHFGEGHQESMRGVSNSDLGGSHLTIPTMVLRPGPSDTHSFLLPSATAGPADPTEDQGTTQQSRQAPASRLVTVRESLLSSGASDRVFQLVSQSRRDSTENV